ncbi:SPOR domain-containing protein [uncultured Brevundimonas sp.]|uniref:SPOR domain-containing protein n=1 Tax=uncultured Brevundimonas sp. TaxID=213418 RepID=UPI0025F94050|nr:SPOR domain-containing protein [uncultured Brevundimonas sp.]
MTFVACVRPVLVLLAIAGSAGCGAVEDPHRFETMAQQVADIPLDGQVQPKAQSVKAQTQGGLRPALQVDVMDVHDFWDARDGIVSATDAVVDGAADRVKPVVSQAVVREAEDGADVVALRPAIHAQDVPLETVMRPSSGLVQLGAYASEEAARAAWARLKSGSAAWALEGLTPVYEAVEVNGRRLVRLKVQTPPAGAPAVCAAAGIDDPWCHRAT